MIRRSTSRAAVVAAASLGVVALSATSALGAPASGTRTAPSTAVSPYLLPVAGGVTITSHLTEGETPRGGDHKMVGIPDGIGVLPAANGTIDVLMNHELGATQGRVRDHGETGAFVSRNTLDPRTGAVVANDDFIKDVSYWQYAYGTPAGTYAPAPTAPFLPQFGRFCSGALTDPGQLLNEDSGNGTTERIYFANEEVGNNGRAFGVTAADGVAHQLPRLGLFSWENTLAAPNVTDTTVVMGNEDSGEGQVWVYRGTKTGAGSAIDRAGLTNGINSVIDVVDESVSTDAEFRARYGKGTPAPVDLSEVDWNQPGDAQNREAAAEGLTLNRIEDGAFDPRNPDDYYFLTTVGGDTTPQPSAGEGTRDGGGLWKLSFQDVERPELGATLTLVLDGSEEPYLNNPDNMDIDDKGNIVIQEDPGSQVWLARIVAYRIADGATGTLARFDADQFRPGGSRFITTNEESSGILDVSDAFGKKGTFVFDAQVHQASGNPETVEEGQLLTMTVQSWGQVYRNGKNPR